MKWKKHTLKIAIITVSIITSCLALAPNDVVCADLPDAEKLAAIESIVATGDSLSAVLTIKLTSPVTYTSYKTTAPLRLVIDFSQASQGAITVPVIVNKGNFKTVTVSRFDTYAGVLTRVDIELVSDGEAIISSLPSNPGEIKISFPELANTAAASAVAVKASDKPPEVDVPQPTTLTSTPVPVSIITDKDVSFRTLNAISVHNNVITFSIDGEISDFKTFRLNKPERYVVDLINVRSGLSAKLLPLNASGVASARIGIYPDKVRVVLDAVNGSFPEAAAVKTDAGVVITLDSKPIDENANTKLTSTRVEKSLVDNKTPSTKINSQVAVNPATKPALSSTFPPDSSTKEKPESVNRPYLINRQSKT